MTLSRGKSSKGSGKSKGIIRKLRTKQAGHVTNPLSTPPEAHRRRSIFGGVGSAPKKRQMKREQHWDSGEGHSGEEDYEEEEVDGGADTEEMFHDYNDSACLGYNEDEHGSDVEDCEDEAELRAKKVRDWAKKLETMSLEDLMGLEDMIEKCEEPPKTTTKKTEKKKDTRSDDSDDEQRYVTGHDGETVRVNASNAFRTQRALYDSTCMRRLLRDELLERCNGALGEQRCRLDGKMVHSYIHNDLEAGRTDIGGDAARALAASRLSKTPFIQREEAFLNLLGAEQLVGPFPFSHFLSAGDQSVVSAAGRPDTHRMVRLALQNLMIAMRYLGGEIFRKASTLEDHVLQGLEASVGRHRSLPPAFVEYVYGSALKKFFNGLKGAYYRGEEKLVFGTHEEGRSRLADEYARVLFSVNDSFSERHEKDFTYLFTLSCEVTLDLHKHKTPPPGLSADGTSVKNGGRSKGNGTSNTPSPAREPTKGREPKKAKAVKQTSTETESEEEPSPANVVTPLVPTTARPAPPCYRQMAHSLGVMGASGAVVAPCEVAGCRFCHDFRNLKWSEQLLAQIEASKCSVFNDPAVKAALKAKVEAKTKESV